MAPYACIPKIPLNPGKLEKNVELMQPVIKNAKSRETEPGCQAYYFFTPKDGNGEVMWGVEIYDDEKAIKETHFNSPAFQNFAAQGQAQQVSPGPPEINFGHLRGGWLTRPNEGPRTNETIILFAKYTVKSGKRAEFSKVLLEGLGEIEKNEPGTLSILLIEDEKDENVVYVLERFGNQKGLEGHMNGEAGKKALPVVKELMESREGGFFREVAGFVSKDE